MTPKEIKDIVAVEVTAATELLQQYFESKIAELSKTVEQLKTTAGAEPKAVKEEPKKVPVIPDTVMKHGDMKLKFAYPTFVFKRKLYVAEAEVENTELIAELVKNQQGKDGFQDGVLKQIN